jgi:hypothetical protein
MKTLVFLLLLISCGQEAKKEGDTYITTPAPVIPPPVVVEPPPVDECKDGYTAGFAEVANVVANNCLGCHPGYNSYEVFRIKIDEAVRRINLGSNDPRRMPPPPNNELSPQEKNLLEGWRNDGAKIKKECRDGLSSAAFLLDADYIRSNILRDLRKQDPDVRAQERFLIGSHHYNKILGRYPESLIADAVNKMVNSVSRVESIKKITTVDSKNTIFRIDLEAFGLTKADWKTIVDADRFKIKDLTTDGKLISDLTTSDQPWLHIDNFINTALSPRVYNKIMRIPVRAKDLYEELGVDRQAQHDTKSVRYLGFTGSPISNTNRRLRRYETQINDNGFLWVTNDTDDNDLPETIESNVFEFPFSDETGGFDIFQYRAEEWIWQLDNGMLGFALFDFPDQLRQEIAPVTVVRQTSPFDAEISVGRDCFRCHQTLIPAIDQVRFAASQNGDFSAIDIDRIEDFYMPAGVNVALFGRDNSNYSKSLTQLGISQIDDDPINKLVDMHRSDYGLAEVAAFYFLAPQDFQARLRKSQNARRQIPQLLSGGKVTLDQLIVANPDILEEFELFVDED